MITVANRIYVSPEYRDQFEERFRNRARLVDGMPGFVSNQVLRPVNEDDPYIVFTLWESRKDLKTGLIQRNFVKDMHILAYYLKRRSHNLTSWNSMRYFWILHNQS